MCDETWTIHGRTFKSGYPRSTGLIRGFRSVSLYKDGWEKERESITFLSPPCTHTHQ